MRRNLKMYFADILISKDSISEYIIGVKDLESYNQNKLIRRALERELEIIGGE